jgi:1,4-alpha-glucan branching enzyme
MNAIGQSVRYDVSRLTETDIYLFKQGSHNQLFDKLGSHPMTVEGLEGTFFAVWAPNAKSVSVIGDFNGWNPGAHPLQARGDESGIWQGFLPGVLKGEIYKYRIESRYAGYKVDKSDPFARHWQVAPLTASVVWDDDYQWQDAEWMERRGDKNAFSAPMSVYEVHLGSWMRKAEEDNRYLNYRELAPLLANYVKEMGFTHAEFLPVMEHPFYGSWGYQVIGFFAPTSRYGTPQDFMYLVDYLHSEGVGVILDWVPSHFPDDEHGLVYFDGTYLFEHADPRKGYHPDWKSYIFNHGRNEVRSFLLSSANFWLGRCHADGLRVDAVASMLYLDYSREDGEWIPNEYGGRENLEAISFLRRFNELAYEKNPGIQTVAEESTAWPMVTRPSHVGGLGFGMKWNMGWMHDTLEFFKTDPIYRKYQHGQLTFSAWYSFSENFMLSLSHDEVVHGKGSLLGKMPGDDWRKFANLRLLFGYMFAHPGKKLLFMGGEIAQWREWAHEESLEWHLLDHEHHSGMQRWVRDLNSAYRGEPALHELDFQTEGFEWVDFTDWEQSIISFLRLGTSPRDVALVVCNFTPVPRYNYRVGVPRGGFWREILNSDAKMYGGSGQGNFGGVEASPVPCHGRFYSLPLVLPPLGVVVFKPEE